MRPFFLAAAMAIAIAVPACSSSKPFIADAGATVDGGADSGTPPDAGSTLDAGDGGSMDDAGDGGVVPNPFCQARGLPTRAWNTSATNSLRGALAGDFALALEDGSTFEFQASFTGCESYIFLPDIIPVSQLDPTSIWSSGSDLSSLVATSPANVHYFFISLAASDAAAKTNTQAMQARIDALLATLTADDATRWQQHLHVVSGRGQTLVNWIHDAVTSWGQVGFAVDRRQHLRGVGDLADVRRFDVGLQDAGAWPWKSNLAYAVNEAIYMNAQSTTFDRLDAEGARVLPLWTGEVLAQYADVLVELPTAAEIAGYDTLEVEVTMRCPDAGVVEFDSCGAWDYIASLLLVEDAPDGGLPDAGDAGVSYELARFITSYHRETHWVEDISPMLGRLAGGGTRHFQWSFAPPWNTQPTATELSLRFISSGKGYTPELLVPLFSGGTFDDTYDTGRARITAQIPTDMKRVELWMLLTGHGNNPYGCAEFCDHQHQFTVNGMSWTVDFPMAGTLDGCMSMDWSGMVPNQGGTWWTGRGGWCPGGQVDPHVIDVTAQVQAGGTAVVSYEGLFEGAIPPAVSGADIDLTSYLVIYH